MLKDTPDQDTYRLALRTMELSKALTPTYRKLLRVHYAAPRHALTTMELASAMGWDHYGAVNLHYGTFAATLGDRMRWSPAEGRPEADAIVTFEGGGPDDSQALWVMHPALARAIEELKIVSPSRSTG